MPAWTRWMGPRGSIEHPESALTLRLVLAIFGLVVCGVAAAVAAIVGWNVAAIVLGTLAVVAMIDLAVIQYRRHTE